MRGQRDPLVEATAAALAILRPAAGRELVVTQVEDDPSERRPDLYDEDFQASPQSEYQAAVGAAARLALAPPEPKFQNPPPRYLTWCQTGNLVAFQTDHSEF